MQVQAGVYFSRGHVPALPNSNHRATALHSVLHTGEEESSGPFGDPSNSCARKSNDRIRIWRAFQVLLLGSQNEETVPATSLVGILTRPHATLLHQGTFQSFIVMFQVHGLTDLFGVPASKITNHTYEADAVLGKPVRELEQRLGNCETFEQRSSLANHFFAQRLKHVRTVDRMAFAAKQILNSSGGLPSAELARQAGVGVRQFQREFYAHSVPARSCSHASCGSRMPWTPKHAVQQNRGQTSHANSDITIRCTWCMSSENSLANFLPKSCIRWNCFTEYRSTRFVRAEQRSVPISFAVFCSDL
jgi:hypothetical protein